MQESRETWKTSKENTLHETEEGYTLRMNEADTEKKRKILDGSKVREIITRGRRHDRKQI